MCNVLIVILSKNCHSKYKIVILSECEESYNTMKRRIISRLEKADKQENKRSFVIYGMKYTGKTYTVLDYVKQNYEEYLYIDADHNDSFLFYLESKIGETLSKSGIKPDNKTEIENAYSINAVNLFSEYFNIDPEYLVNIPIILDELPLSIIEAGVFDGYNGLLKLFIITEAESNARKIATIVNAEEAVFQMLPMDFGEFLIANDREWYEEVITGHVQSKRKIPDMIHEELLDLFGLYEQIGGCPEVVMEYLQSGSTENIRSKQEAVQAAILYRIIKECGNESIKVRIQNIWDAMEQILQKDNHKFMYTAIRDGATRREYAPVIDYLCDHGVCLKVSEDSKKECGFRLYAGDFGLYENPNPSVIRESILVQNIISSGTNIYYWESGKGATVSIIADIGGKKVPVELKTSGKSNLRSVKSYMKERDLEKYISLGEENIKDTEAGPVIPVYACHLIGSIRV